MKQLTLLLFFCISIATNAQTQVTIAWDTSLSMQDRASQKEFDFINKFFAKYTDANVTVLQFNNVSATTSNFNISGGNWDVVKKKLESSTYDGATSYEQLTNIPATSMTLLFTDGYENVERDMPTLGSPLYVVNGNADHDIKNLQFLALANKGRLINLVSAKTASNSNAITYSGNVYSENSSTDEIAISVKGTNKKVTPTKDGTYSIEAAPGDVLVFTAAGVAPVEKVLTKDNTLNVWIKNDGIQLDQVLIKSEKQVATESVNTGDANRDKKTVGYAVSSIKSEELNQGVSNISDATEGKISGAVKGSSQDLSQTLIRGMSTISGNNYPLIIIDGAPIAQSSSASRTSQLQITDFIDPNNIADVTILKGLAATNKYGSEGSSGVILIKTKMEAAREEALKTGKKVKAANYYEGKVLAATGTYTAPYLNDLKKASSTEAGYTSYLNQRSRYWDDPMYFVDVFNHFQTSSPKQAKAIGYNVLERKESSISSLRSMLFTAKEAKESDLALDIANVLLEKYPQQTQSYLDVALAQKNKGNYQIALDMLLAMANGSINPGLDFSSLLKTVNNEIRNLVANHKSELELSKIAVSHLKKPVLDARIVFDWSNPDAEFELLFVNPANLFFKWEHTLNNPERLEEELVKGFTQEEFEIEGGDKGQWLINVKYLGNRTIGNTEPTLLRCMVQYDYGKPTERTEERIIRLQEKGSEQLAVKVITK